MLFPFVSFSNLNWPTRTLVANTELEDPKQTLGMVFGNLQKELVVHVETHPGQWSLPGRTRGLNLAEEAQMET